MAINVYTFRETRGIGKRGPRVIWTPEMDATLRDLYVIKKLPQIGVANEMRLCVNVVSDRLDYLKYKRPYKASPEVHEKYLRKKIRKILGEKGTITP